MTGLSSDGVADRLSKATLALLPYPDGASMRRTSLLAAAMCGVPIVTRSGSETPPELAALLSSASGVTEMAMLVSDHLGSPAALKAAHENSCRLAAMVSWDAIAARYATIIAAAAANGRARPDALRQAGAVPQHRPVAASGAVP